MKKIFFLSIAVLLFGYIVFAIAFIAPKVSTEGVCRGITVDVADAKSHRFISEKEILVSLKNSGLSPEGKNLKEINTSKIEEKLLENKIISRAECFKTVDRKIKVKIYQRKLFIRVFPVGKSSFYVDGNREIIPASSGVYPAYVPVASGFISEEFARTKLFDFVKFIKDDKFWNAQIAQIFVAQNGDVEFTPTVGNHQVIIGKLTGYEEKLDKLKLFYNNGLNVIGWNKFSVINLKYKDMVVCKK
jgi:cell division protein FtsQ